MKKVLKCLKWFILHIEDIIAIVALSIMLCSIFFNVMMRYIFRNPTSWADELSMICLAYVTFVGGAAAYKKNLHFGIEVLLDKLPFSVKMFVRRLINFCCIPLFAYTGYLGYQLMDSAVKRMNYTHWSYKLMDASVPLGFLSMTIYAIYFFIMSFTNYDAYVARYENSYEEETVDEELVRAGEEMFAAVDAENDTPDEGGNDK